MARLSFNPRDLFQPEKLGENDLKLYSEAAILGLKNQPPVYEVFRERIVVMAGVNLPVFGLLDVLSVEGEWYGSALPNNPETFRMPFPSRDEFIYGNEDDWSWAVTLEKRILEYVTVRGRVASDHLRTGDDPALKYQRQRTNRPDEWYWSLKLTLRF
jgi:hypothetical protein